MKSKLGVSVGLIGAAIYFATYFGGLIPALLLVGYVLLFEDNEWLRKNAVKAIALSIFFSVVVALINLVPNILSVLSSLLNVFDVQFSYEIVYSIVNIVTLILDIIEKCLFLLLGIGSLTQGSISVPFIDNIINEHLK